MEEDNKVESKPEEQEVSVNKFACLGIAECQQVLERLKGGNIMDSLPHAVQTLMDEFKHDKDSLKREVKERIEELQRHRKKANDLQISKKYAPALEAYDAYFAVLGSQIGDYEAEKLRKECRQYVEQAKKKKIQMIVAAVVALILCGVIVDQIIFRKNVNTFNAALVAKDLDNSMGAAVKISWRYDTDTGIANLVSYHTEKDLFYASFSDEVKKTGLDNYGGLEWQEVQDLMAQAHANEDLPQAIQQVRQASSTMPGLINDCETLEKNERDFSAMYESCNQKDADFYAHEDWQALQELRIEVTQTNLNVITERYELMVDITNQVATLMRAQEDMQPVKEEFEKVLQEERIQVQGQHNYVSSELEKAKELAGIAQVKEERFEFADARLIYTRATEHVKASRQNRQVDVKKLADIEEARREFFELYEKRQEDIEQAQGRYPVEWKALSEQKKKADLEYAKKARWDGDAYVDYNTAMIRLKYLIEIIDNGDEMYVSMERCNLLYDQVKAGVANKWFADEWNAVRDQKKKADDTYKNGDHNRDDVRVYYDETSQMLEDLLVKISDKAKKNYDELCDMIETIQGNLGKLEKFYPGDWGELQVLVDTAEMEYRKPSYWESGAYNTYISASKKLFSIYKTGKEVDKKITDFNDFKLKEYDEDLNSLSDDADTSSSTGAGDAPNP